MIRVCVAGVTGWTGSAVANAVEEAADLELVAGVSRSDPTRFSSVAEALDEASTDVLVDYTHASTVGSNVRAALERGVAVVVGSSGLAAADYAELDALARERGVGVVAAGNFSLSAALVLRFAVDAARHFERWEVIDYASATKPDAPSGTARELAERLGDRRVASGVGAGDARDELEILGLLDGHGNRTARPTGDAGDADADHVRRTRP